MKKMAIAMLFAGSTLLMADGAALYKAGNCTGCHGANGEKVHMAPVAIGGQSAADLETKLKGYQDGTYGGTKKGMMAFPVKGKSAEDIKALAEYVSTLSGK